MNLNETAFLSMISHSEGTDRDLDPYRCCFGFRHRVIDMSDHPSATGEWRGESIAFLGPRYAGMVSTAAGRYQIILPTWKVYKLITGVPDFTGPSQDTVAIEIIRRQGAGKFVSDGAIETAIALCRSQWASLPGSDAGQPQRRLADLLVAFTAGGGTLAA